MTLEIMLISLNATSAVINFGLFIGDKDKIAPLMFSGFNTFIFVFLMLRTFRILNKERARKI